MQALICIETPEWELTIYSQHLDNKQKTYLNMLNRRGADISPSSLKVQPPISTKKIKIRGQEQEVQEGSTISDIAFEVPLFFENTQYQFEWIFLQTDIENAFLGHSLKKISDSFRFTAKRRHSAASLIGAINTGNDIGQLTLPLELQIGGIASQLKFTLEVLPMKMLLHSDLPSMYQSIDEAFPLWRFSLAEITEQNSANSKNRGSFPLLWLAQFKSLREKFELGLKVIANSPHNRLQSRVFNVKAEQLKGRLSNRLSEKVQEDVKNRLYDRHYKQKKKYLNVDTPENRFIKMVVTQCKRQLERISKQLEVHNIESKEMTARFSEYFLNELKVWQQSLLRLERYSFLREVGKFDGQYRESLVLQQKTGYSAVYRTWQDLKNYLDIFSKQSTVSMKSVAETYEVWCLLEIRKILITVLGFEEKEQRKSKLKLNNYFELKLEDGLTGAGAFEFVRVDGLKAKLAHEPVFREKSKNIRSFGITQKPDILLEISFPNGKQSIWLFDAKYRIKNKKSRFDTNQDNDNDYAPDDAINQMHRYRDALIRIEMQSDLESKSRPVFGAFALYPGFYIQEDEPNPYDTMIREVGIGAFALLPSGHGHQNLWLETFLIEQLGKVTFNYSSAFIHDALFINEPARIPYSGMKQMLHSDLVLISRLGKGRDHHYIDNFNNGTAKWFHIPLAVFDAKFGKHIAQELSYLAVIENNNKLLEITKVYKVKNVLQKNRFDITAEQSGVEVSQVGEDLYWLFELSGVITLNRAIQYDHSDGFRQTLKLAKLLEIEDAKKFTDINAVYERSLTN